MSVGQADVTDTVQGGRLGELFQVQQTGPDGFPQKVRFFTVSVSFGVHDRCAAAQRWTDDTEIRIFPTSRLSRNVH